MQRRFVPRFLLSTSINLRRNVIFSLDLRKYEFWSLGKIPEKYSALRSCLEKEDFVLSCSCVISCYSSRSRVSKLYDANFQGDIFVSLVSSIRLPILFRIGKFEFIFAFEIFQIIYLNFFFFFLYKFSKRSKRYVKHVIILTNDTIIVWFRSNFSNSYKIQDLTDARL